MDSMIVCKRAAGLWLRGGHEWNGLIGASVESDRYASSFLA
jgi:hypothetical protein